MCACVCLCVSMCACVCVCVWVDVCYLCIIGVEPLRMYSNNEAAQEEEEKV